MLKTVRSYCPLDCPDVCAFNVHINNGIIEKITGDIEHPYTQGFICSKSQRLVERLYSPDRITSPLRRKNGGFVKISWEQALDEIAQKLTAAKEKYGPTSVMYYTDEGSAGILRALEKRFFNAFGGATFTEGTLCWGAVCGAQKRDFGEYRAHLWEDVHNSKTIVLWGRNIAVTNIHLVPFIRDAQKNGAYVITIDPNKSQTAAMFDQHISIRPGTDGVFAMGIAHLILKNGWADLDYISKNTDNFEDYLKEVKKYPPEVTSEITGVSEEVITDFARRYAKSKPSCIWLGYGMQRYNDAGQTVSAIDSLGAITGNIGVAGGGVNHASQYNKRLFKDISASEMATEIRLFKKAKTAEGILEADPPIEVLFVTASNPLTQLPNTNKVAEAFNKIPFKVVSDFFLTDTAQVADLILPCASIFEKEDLIASSWTPFIGYNPKILNPKGEAKADYDIFAELADLMKLEKFENKKPQLWLEEALEPAKEHGITLEKLKKEHCKNPLYTETAWQDGEFETETKKFKLLNKFEITLNDNNRLRLLTTHHAKTMHSQFYNLLDTPNQPFVYISVALAEKMYLRDMDNALIETQFGNVTVLIKILDGIHPECVVMHEGSWIKEGGGVNLLTGDYLSDLGNGTSYNEVFCNIQKLV